MSAIGGGTWGGRRGELLDGSAVADTVAAMANLSSSASKRLASIKARPQLPEWWTLVQIGMGVAFFLFLAWRFMSPGPGSLPGEDGTVAGPSGPSITTPTTTAPAAMASVPGPDGAALSVPSPALAQAQAAATALFTTDFSGVRLVAGSTPPALARSYPAPVLSEPRVDSQTATGFVFSFNVDPDGAGPEPVRRIATSVVDDDGSWAYLAG